jgi:hypothetical protein
MPPLTAPHTAEWPIDRLHALLPAVHRRRDNDMGDPLRALLQVMMEQADLIEEDLRQLYDNWFIETCTPWVVPYIAELIGHEPLSTPAGPDEGPAARARNAALLPRREVANTLRARRRKGTLALLELLAADVAGWPARAVEFSRLLRQTQSLRLSQSARGRGVDLRDSAALGHLGSPFETLAHAPDVRRLISQRASGLFAAANVAVFIWRLKACSITRAPAALQEDVGPGAYTFSVLGNDAPLFNRPRAQAGDDVIAGPLNVPQAIGLRAFSAPMAEGARFATASTNYYGLATGEDGATIAQSLAIWAPGWPTQAADDGGPIPASRIIPADLDGWLYQPPRNHVAVDTVRGRIAFPPRQAPKRMVSVSYHHGFSADIGGGEYTRPVRQHPEAVVIRVTGSDALREALKPWLHDGHAAEEPATPAEQPAHAVIELTDSGVYVLPVHIHLQAGHSLQLRAAQRTRPVLRLLDWQVDRSDNLVVHGGPGSRFTLDGLMLAGRGLQVEGPMASVTIRHATLVPGWSLAPDCEPKRPSEPSIEVIDSGACIVVEHSIVGAIQVNNDEVVTDPIRIQVSDSVIDATGNDCDSPQCEAVGGVGSRLAFAVLHMARSTVIGRVMVHAIALAENSILLGRVTVARRQIGCIRFSYVRPGSRTPRRFQCQPDLVERAALREGQARGDTPAQTEAVQREEQVRVRPRFDSLRYGVPTYCRLSVACVEEIVRGAEDESEMGVFHDLYNPQRLASLRQRLDEYAPAAADTGIVFAD